MKMSYKKKFCISALKIKERNNQWLFVTKINDCTSDYRLNTSKVMNLEQDALGKNVSILQDRFSFYKQTL